MSDAIQRGIRGFSSLVLLQLGSRVLTFALNVALARSMDPRLYGVTAIQLQLVVSTILFLSREALRRACQREDGDGSESADANRRLVGVLSTYFSHRYLLASTLFACPQA